MRGSSADNRLLPMWLSCIRSNHVAKASAKRSKKEDLTGSSKNISGNITNGVYGKQLYLKYF
jgi:hypothetical protein